MATPTERRSFLAWLTWVTGGLAAVLFALPLVGYFLGPLQRRRVLWVDLGNVGQFPANDTRLVTFDNPLQQPWDGMTAKNGVFVRNLGGQGSQPRFLVLCANCTHLNCGVSWFPQSGLFMCPCHGGVYYEDGERASGPPPRGLFHCVWRVRNRHLEIQAPHLPTLQDPLAS